MTISPDQYEDFDTTNDVLGIEGNKGGILVFDDELDSKEKASDSLSKRNT